MKPSCDFVRGLCNFLDNFAFLRMTMVKKFLFFVLIMSSADARAQFHTAASRSELGVMLGVSTYLGDLNQFIPFRQTHPAGGILYRYNMNPRMAIRVNATYGRVSASDAQSTEVLNKARNLSFFSDIYEVGAGIELNYFPFQLGNDRYKGTAYILAEIAVFRMNPKTMYNGSEVALRPLGTEGQGTSLNSKNHYNLTQVSIPLGVGAKVSLGERAGLNFEIGIRKTFTDYLDDVGADNYVDQAVLAAESGPLAAELSNLSGDRYGKRGNAATRDWYIFAGMMVTFSLGDPAKCMYKN